MNKTIDIMTQVRVKKYLTEFDIQTNQPTYILIVEMMDFSYVGDKRIYLLNNSEDTFSDFLKFIQSQDFQLTLKFEVGIKPTDKMSKTFNIILDEEKLNVKKIYHYEPKKMVRTATVDVENTEVVEIEKGNEIVTSSDISEEHRSEKEVVDASESVNIDDGTEPIEEKEEQLPSEQLVENETTHNDSTEKALEIDKTPEQLYQALFEKDGQLSYKIKKLNEKLFENHYDLPDILNKALGVVCVYAMNQSLNFKEYLYLLHDVTEYDEAKGLHVYFIKFSALPVHDICKKNYINVMEIYKNQTDEQEATSLETHLDHIHKIMEAMLND